MERERVNELGGKKVLEVSTWESEFFIITGIIIPGPASLENPLD